MNVRGKNITSNSGEFYVEDIPNNVEKIFIGINNEWKKATIITDTTEPILFENLESGTYFDAYVRYTDNEEIKELQPTGFKTYLYEQTRSYDPENPPPVAKFKHNIEMPQAIVIRSDGDQ